MVGGIMEKDCYITTAKIQECHWWYEGRRRIIEAILENIGLPDKAAILEAGCGTGANLPTLRMFGDVSAFDPEEYAVEKAREVSGCRVEKGGLPGSVPFEGPFDLVGAFDVIEHIEDDLESLQTLCRLTKEGGFAVFTVPAFQCLWSHHDVVNHHKRRYTRKAFARLLEQAGYEVSFISYYNTWLFPAAVLVRYLKKLTGRELESDAAMPGSARVNTMLGRIFSSERYMLRFFSLPVGLSIIAVCRRAAGGK